MERPSGRQAVCGADGRAGEGEEDGEDERNPEHGGAPFARAAGCGRPADRGVGPPQRGKCRLQRGCKDGSNPANRGSATKTVIASRDDKVRFRVLGSLEVEVDGVAVALGGTRQRTVLAVLLVHANEPVATDRLVSESWGENAPASATKTAQVYVSRLRGTLGTDTLAATPGGYLLGVPQGALDTDELEELRARAREADPREAGPAAAPGSRPLARPAVCRPALRRGAADRDQTPRRAAPGDARGAHRGRPRRRRGVTARPRAGSACREHPHRERLRGFLMLALYRSGRQAEALETYQQGRQLLDSDLGLEPGPELKELERAILAHDPALDGPQRAIRRKARRRSGALLAAGGVLLLAAALTAVVLVRDRGERASRGAGAEALDAQTGKLLATVPLGAAPSSVAVGAGAVWVLDADDKTISMIDPETRSRESFQHLVHPDRPRRRCRGALDRERVSRAPVLGYELPGERLAPRPGDARRCYHDSASSSQASFGTTRRHVSPGCWSTSR